MPRKPKNPLAFLSMRVSTRDRAIFDAVRIHDRNQQAVAVEFGLSQQRVSEIVARVARWLSLPVPLGLDELPREDRLRYLSREHVMRLEGLRRKANAEFENSRVKHTVRRKTIKGETSEEVVVTRVAADRRYLREAADLDRRIMEFQGFDRYGNVDTSCEGRVHEAPKRTDNEVKRAVKKCVMNGELDTPGDEGIPGAWEKEMAVTNAKVAAASGVGSIFGQHDSAIANSGRPENRPDPLEVARPQCAADETGLAVAGPLSSATQKGSGDFSGQPVVAEQVKLPEKTPDPDHANSSPPTEELLYKNRLESSQCDDQQNVTAKQDPEKVLLKSVATSNGSPPPQPAGPPKPLKPLSERLEYMRRPYTKPVKWPEPPPGKEWLQDPEYLYELGMAIHGRPIAPSLCQTYSEPRRQTAARFAQWLQTAERATPAPPLTGPG